MFATDHRSASWPLVVLAVAFGSVFVPLHGLLQVAPSLLAISLATIGGALGGRRGGIALACVLGALEAGLYWLTDTWSDVSILAGATAIMAVFLGLLAGALCDRANRAQRLAQEADYSRERVQSEVAELARSEERLRSRGEQQAALVTIGERALLAEDLHVLLQDVAQHIGTSLGVDLCSIWTAAPTGELVAQATYAAPSEQHGTDEGPRRHAAYTYWVKEPVVVGSLRNDPRLRGVPLDGWLTSGAAVPISMRGAEAPYGVLAVHTRQERVFGAHDLTFLAAIATVIVAAVARKSAEERLQRQALRDPLTGLANRSLFQDRLAHALHTARRDAKPLALILMDLDRFKDVNDTLGHQAGDELLLEVGERLQRAKRATDTVARLGGDEFALILPAVVDLPNAARLATDLLATIERPMSLQDQSIDIGASIGLALYPEHGDNAEELLRRADVAMYAAKRSGSGVTVYASELDQHSRRRLALAAALRMAIEGDQLELHYQPQVDLRTGELAGFEALLRWNHPELGQLTPDTFIPLAEEMGLVASLDRWALDVALQQTRAWQDAGVAVPISVNLSMRNVLDQNLARIVGDLIARWDVAPRQLELEITESSIMADPLKVRAVLAQCRALGVRMAIDDFGTGYSSLAYLKNLPVDSLKIDRSFVSDMAADKSDLAIVRSTIELGHNLGLRLIAEGVEDEITGRLLSQMRCDVGQGYHFSGPLTSGSVLAWAARSRRNGPLLRQAA